MLRRTLCIVVALIAAGAAPAVAAPVPFASVLTVPEVPAAVWDPGAVVISPSGNIAIVDSGNDRVRMLAADGSLICDIGASGVGDDRLIDPQNAAFGPDGNVYIADTENGRVQVFEPDGDHLRSIGSTAGLADPTGVAVDAAGNVYVTERTGHRVAKFDASGGFVARWGSLGAGNLRFQGPRGIVVDATGKLFIADTGNQRIEALDSSTGAYLGEWGYYTGAGGTTLSRYVAPVSVSLTAAGDVIVTDMGTHRIERCSPVPRPPALSLAPLQTWGGPPPGSGYNQLQSPRGAALTTAGALYVADSGNGRISRWASGVWQQPWVGSGAEPGMLSSPLAVAAGPFGGVVVADTANHRLVFFDSLGTLQSVVGTRGVDPGEFDAPGGLAFGPDGYLYVSDTGNDCIQRLNPDGSFVATFGVGLSAPRGITFDADGVMLVADSGSGRIARFAPGGAPLGSFGSLGNGNGQFLAPCDVTVDPSGALWVADTGNHRVQKLDAASGLFRFATAGFGTGNGLMIEPQGVTALSDGSVLVADTGNTRFQHLGPGGDFIQVAGGRGVTAWVPHAPVDAAAMPDGRTWALERDGAVTRLLLRDGDAPSTAMNGLPSGPVNVPVELSLTASDTFSGVRGSYYRIGSGLPLNYVGPFTVSAEGTTLVGYYSVDRAGNREVEHTATVVIDTTPPSGTFTVAGGDFYSSSRTVGVESSVTDALEMRVGVGLDMSEWAPYSASTTTVVLPDTDGPYTVVGEYRDALRNTLRLTRTIILDREGPAAPDVSSPTHPLGTVMRKVTDATFQWPEPADIGQVVGYSYALDRVPTTIPDDAIDSVEAVYQARGLTGGTWYFHVRAIDAAGNWGPVRHRAIRLTSVPSVAAPSAVYVSTSGGRASYRVTGAVRPYHYAGGTVLVTAYRYEAGRWVPRIRTTMPVVPASATTSRYRGFVALPTGLWRLRAYHAYDGVFEPAWSAYGTSIDLR